MAGAFKHKFSPTVVSYFLKLYEDMGKSYRKAVASIKEQHGYDISHDTFRKIVTDPDAYTQDPHLYD